MAMTAQTTRFDQARASTDTDRRHLLADSATASSAASTISSLHSGERTPRAHSPARSLAVAAASQEESSPSQLRTPARHQSIAATAPHRQPYRGFASEEEYLAALRAWADSKRFVEPTDTTLHGFYGETTMDELASRPPALEGLGLRKKWRARKASKLEERTRKMGVETGGERRATVA